ncbi:MAG TPA: hypothetical protein VII63_04630 [Caulobacteraceae bacterium]
MKYWILAGAALAIAGSAHGQPAPGAAVHKACQADIAKFCAATQPGPDRGQCMRQHKDELSADCKAARLSMHAAHGAQPGEPLMAPAAPAPTTSPRT